ncbi:hypothetical protein R1flu_007167 [Riccia fluitans]|uniref:Uncharacterized protein n=1 Tax=Riccia fluitans TaxID=41844 RepID=A0ABD1YY26_9MARC
MKKTYSESINTEYNDNSIDPKTKREDHYNEWKQAQRNEPPCLVTWQQQFAADPFPPTVDYILIFSTIGAFDPWKSSMPFDGSYIDNEESDERHSNQKASRIFEEHGMPPRAPAPSAKPGAPPALQELRVSMCPYLRETKRRKSGRTTTGHTYSSALMP